MTKMYVKSLISLLFTGRMRLYKVFNKDFPSYYTHPLSNFAVSSKEVNICYLCC